MKRLCALAVSAAVLLCAVLLPAAPAAAANDWFIASETFYRADVAAGTLAARVEAHIQNGPSARDLAAVTIWTMSGAKDVVVTKDGVALETKALAADAKTGVASVSVTLPRPLKAAAKSDFTVSYTVAAQSSDRVHLAPGTLEAMFVSQGPGSFVFADLPTAADNYFEPGCLRVTKQPAELGPLGLERWVCGEALGIAVNQYSPEVAEKCANLDDSCRQRLNLAPFAGFVQSSTDPAARGLLETDVPMTSGPVKLTFKYFRHDQAWAEQMFRVAAASLPRLEAVFGYPYSKHTMLMRQSRFLNSAGVLGLAFPEDGEFLLTKTDAMDAEVVVHEMAHQWAGFNLAAKWEWEGLAEYAMRTVAPTMGIKPYDRRWTSFTYKDTLAQWLESSTVRNPDYWYGKAGAFWFEYEKAIGGPEAMRRVLAGLANPPAPRDARWFMDAGERESGANLDALFLQWVFPESAKPLLAERRAAYAQIKALDDRTRYMGMSGRPRDVTANLESWQFAPIEGQVVVAYRLLDAYTKTYADQVAAGLPETVRLSESWAKSTLAEIGSLIEDQRLAMDAILAASRQLESEPITSPGRQQLIKAKETYLAGDFNTAKKLATGAMTAASNSAAAGKMIELAKAKQASFSPSPLAKVGLLFADPDGDLAAAEKAAGAGDGLTALKRARAAYDAWEGAESAGLMRLAAVAALLSAGAAGAWWLRARRGGKPPANAWAPGHALGHEERRTWRDWENSGR